MASDLKIHPWEHRRWRGGLCRPGLGGKAIFAWFMTSMFSGVAVGIALKAPEMVHFSRVRWQVLIPGGFAAVGLILLVVALVATARWMRFGGCRIRLRTLPGVVGGHFGGDVLLPESFPPDTDVRMELVCERTTTVPGKGSDDHASVSVAREWARTIRIATSAAYCHDGHCTLPFDFTVPYGLPDETDSRREGNTRIDLQWNLRVFARLRGPDLDMTYRVPVFRTAESSPAVTGETDQGKSLDSILRDTGETRRVRIETVQGVTTFICDAHGLKAGLSLFPMIFGLVFLAVPVIMIVHVLPSLVKDLFTPAHGWYNLMRLFPLVMSAGACLFIVVFGLIGLLMLFIGVHGLIARHTWVEGGMLHQRASLLGIPWQRSCPCNSITGVNCNDTTSSGGRSWHDVVLERESIRRLKKAPWLYLFTRIAVATNVGTPREAEEIAAKLRVELRLPADADGHEALERETA